MVAIPFITWNGVTNQYTINDQAIAFLSGTKGCLAVLGMAGRYRTGKSFALNRIILNGKNSFQTGSTTNACTRGIWIHDEVEVWESPTGEEIRVLIVDSEGLSSTDNAQNDPQIFGFLLLLSSFLIYNCTASIDDSALQSLSLVANLSKTLRIQCDRDSTTEELSKIFPTFCFLIRDFTLQIQNTHGEAINANEYLESSIAPNGSQHDAVKNVIRDCFPDRMCFTMVRPCQEEKDLENLNNLPESRCRAVFVDQMNEFRGLLRSRIKNKLYFGNPVSGKMLLAMATDFVTGVNNGAMPAVKDSWQMLMEMGASETFDICLDLFDQTIRSYEQSQEIKSSESLFTWLSTEKKKAIAYLKQNLDKSIVSLHVAKLDKKLQAKIESTITNNTGKVKHLLECFINEITITDDIYQVWNEKTQEIFTKIDKTESTEAIWSGLSIRFLWKHVNQKAITDKESRESFEKKINELLLQIQQLETSLESFKLQEISLRATIDACESKLVEEEKKYHEMESIHQDLLHEVKTLKTETMELMTMCEEQKSKMSASAAIRFELAESEQKVQRFTDQITQLNLKNQANDDKFVKFMEQTKLESLNNSKKIKEWQLQSGNETKKLQNLLDTQTSKYIELQEVLKTMEQEKNIKNEQYQKLVKEQETWKTNYKKLQTDTENQMESLKNEKLTAVNESKTIQSQYFDFQVKSGNKTRELETKIACGSIEIQNYKRRLTDCEEDASVAKKMKFECQRLQSEMESNKNIILYLEKDKQSKDQQVSELRDQVSKLEERFTNCQRDREMDLLRFQISGGLS
jgi:hypothetical protein